MKKLICFISFLFVLSCASSQKSTSKDAVNASSINPQLALDLKNINNCGETFWRSDYGHAVAQKDLKADISVTDYFNALTERPKACLMNQILISSSASVKVREKMNDKKINENRCENYA